MRILFLAPQPFYESRGTPIAVKAALEGIVRLGHRVDLLTYSGGQDIPLPGVTIHRIARPAMVKTIPIGVSWQKIPCDWVMYRQAQRMLRDNRYDLIHAVEEAGFIARRLTTQTGVPYVFDMDSLMSSQILETSKLFFPISWVFGWLERRAIRDSAGVLAVCPVLVDHAKKHHPSGNVTLLPDQPVLQREGSIADPCGFAQMPGLKLVYVGNLERYQGIDLLLDAYRLVAEEIKDTTLIIIGGQPDQIAQYMTKAGDLETSGRVRFLGPRPLGELPAILRASDVLLSPRSKGINTPMKIYNYMESGRAILATRMLTHTQVLDDATACLVDPTPRAFADGLRRVATDAAYRRRIGDAARAKLQLEYSVERWQQRLATFYLTLASASATLAEAPPVVGT
jgi:glycosyltransferase involved in cell wall biosynthesis